MTLQEHYRCAEHAWQTIADARRRLGRAFDGVLYDSLRRQSVRFAPLYPLIEARRGKPA